MRSLKSVTGLCLSVVLLCQTVIPARAEVKKPDTDDTGQWERLLDNRLEYDEIEDRIVNFGSEYLSAQYQMSKNYAAYETAVYDLNGTIEDTRSSLKDARESGDAVEIGYNQAILAAEEEARDALKKVLKIIKGSTDRVLNTTVKGTLVKTTEDLMITYYRLVSAMELLDASVALGESACNSALTQKSLGMATDTDILAAQDNLLTAKVQQQSTRKQLNQIKQNLHMLTGWNYDAEIEFGAIPEPDQDRIAGMNPEADMEKAIGNNYTLSDLRHTPAAGALEKQNRLERMAIMEAEIKAGVNRAYAGVLEARSAYQAASASYESARLNYEAAGRQYQLGTLSPLQHQQMTVVYLSEQMNYDNARLDLFQTMEAYDWAIAGQLNIE